MALNPPMTPEGEPCRVNGEYFIMKRDGISFDMKVKNGNKYSGSGRMILTTCRIVCINSDNKKSLFKCFDLPLALLYKESFKQPIFGSNYIGGYCKPLMNILPGDTELYIYFTEGGCGTFVPAFMNILHNVRKNNNKGPDSKLMNSIQSGVFASSAFVDPNDPSKIYIEQPQNGSNNSNTKKDDERSNQSNQANTQSKSSNNMQDNSIGNNIIGINSKIITPPLNSESKVIDNSQSNGNNYSNISGVSGNPMNIDNSKVHEGGINLHNNTNSINNSDNHGELSDPNHVNPPGWADEEYPSINDLQTNNPQTAENINNASGNNNNENNPKYFYFFGPELQKTNNNNNNTNNRGSN